MIGTKKLVPIFVSISIKKQAKTITGTEDKPNKS